MAKHKWHKEICAWADGAEIEVRLSGKEGNWAYLNFMVPEFWDDEAYEYRIKPQPKESQYLYFYNAGGMVSCEKERLVGWDGVLLGKIKLEVDDD